MRNVLQMNIGLYLAKSGRPIYVTSIGQEKWFLINISRKHIVGNKWNLAVSSEFCIIKCYGLTRIHPAKYLKKMQFQIARSSQDCTYIKSTVW